MFENSYFTKPIHITLLCLYLMLTIIGIAGGVLVWVILLRRRQLRNPINYMLLNMSLSDIIASISIYPYMFILDVGTISNSPATLVFMCSLTVGLSLFFIASASSLIMICAMSYYRYVMIRYPMRRSLRFKGRGVIVISIASWLIAFVGMLPGMLSWKYIPKSGRCRRHWKSINSVAYKAVVEFSIVLPFLFLLLSFCAIFKRVRQAVDQHTATQALSRNRLRRAGKMIAILILLFVSCLFPFAVFWMYSTSSSFRSRNEASGGWLSLQWMRITVLFCQLNYSLNSVVFICCNSDLKQEAKQLATTLWSKIRCC